MRKLLLVFIGLLTFSFVYAQADSLKEYTGIYKFPDGSATPSVEITIQDNALYANSSLGAATFVRVSKDTFSIPAHGGMAYFSRNTDGKVSHVHIVVGDLDLQGDKTEGSLAFLSERFWTCEKTQD